MKEGTVVVILGNMDTRIREDHTIEERMGTVVWVLEDEVVVLLQNNLLWKGRKRDVAPKEEQI